MRAAVFEGNGIVKVKNVTKPKIIKDDDVIVKIELCSVCGTDVHITAVPSSFDATPGVILGHEFVGEVVEVGRRVINLSPGDRVVANPNDYCGVCSYCLDNLPNHCDNMVVMGVYADGAFSEYVRISEKQAYIIDKDMPAEVAVYAEPLACVVNGISKLDVQAGQSAVVIGAGPIGLLWVQMLKSNGAYPVFVSEPNEFRRNYAKQCGGDILIDPMQENLEEVVKKHCPTGVNFAVDVVGSQLLTAISVIKKGGKVLLFGMNEKSSSTVFQSAIAKNEYSIIGNWCTNASFPKAVSILKSGAINTELTLTHAFPLEQIQEAIEVLRRGEGVEVVVDPRI